MSQIAEYPHALLWTRERYSAAAASGLFDDSRVELIEGEIIEMSPVGTRHAIAITKVMRLLVQLFPDYHVRIQLPLSLSDVSQPEPDAAVVAGSDNDFIEQHPSHAVLVIEISDATLRYDRSKKASLYARAGIQEYWIINLQENVVEVARNPGADAAQAYGYGYQTTTTLTRQELVAPLALPAVQIPVASLLP